MTTGFGHPEEEQSLVGPPAAADAQSQVGLPAPTPEEIEHEKQHLEAIQQELLKKDKLGLYTDKDLLEESGKKIIVDKGNSQIGVEHETGTPLVKHQSSGAWLSPADAEYEKTLTVVAKEQATLANQQQDGEAQKRDKQGLGEQPHERDVQQIQQMVAINEGSADPNKYIDEAALQRLRQGASAMEIKNIKNLVAMRDGFANAEATDMSPEMEHISPTQLSGPGVEASRKRAAAAMEKRNAQFAEMKSRMDKDKDNQKKG